jgi:hypothetical protein
LVMDADKAVSAAFTGTGTGTDPVDRGGVRPNLLEEAPSLSCKPSWSTQPTAPTVLQAVTWTATPGDANKDNFADGTPPYKILWTGDTELANYCRDTLKLSPCEQRSDTGGSVSLDIKYAKTGTKSGVARITEDPSGGGQFSEASCGTVTVAAAPPCDPNTFSLSATPALIYANYKDFDLSEASTITVAAGSCFTKTVRFALPKDAKLGGADVSYQGIPTSLTPSQFGSGLQFSVALKNKNKPVPNGSYFPLSVCADTKTKGEVSCDSFVDMTLEVTDTPPAGRGGAKGLPLPVFEEF